MQKLIKELIKEGYLRTKIIIEAFNKINREDFVPENFKEEAYLNTPLTIGHGQTISQPLTIAFMLELLQPQEGEKILDIGSGSGYVTALLSYIVGKKGKIYAIERVSELKKMGEHNADKYNFVKKGIAEFFYGDGSLGLPDKMPFDKIHIAAAGKEIPLALKEQLKIGGKLIMPIGGFNQNLVLLEKDGEYKFKEKKYPGFSFVPLITDLNA